MKKRKLWVSIVAGLLAFLMLFSIIFTLIPTKASAVSSGEIKNQINELKSQQEELKAQIEEVNAQYEANENEIIDMVNQKNVIDQEIQYLNQQVENINQQIAAYNLLIADKQDELDDAEARLAELNVKNKERIRAMEEEGELSYWAVLFKANSFSDLLDRLSMIEEIAAADKRRLDEMSAVAEEVATAQAELESEKSALEVTKEELDQTQMDLEAKREEADLLLTDLIAKGEEFELLLEESEDAQSELMKEIAQKEKEYDAAKYREWLATYVPPTTTAKPSSGSSSSSSGSSGSSSGSSSSGSSSAPSSSGWICPVPYYTLTSPFGMREHPVLGYERMHEGVDMACAAGTPIYASRSGKVTTATYSSSAGYYVSINHGDGFSSIYMHMTNYIVRAGTYVNAGQVIGYVGSTGISTGNHLHFGISYQGRYVNPMNYI